MSDRKTILLCCVCDGDKRMKIDPYGFAVCACGNQVRVLFENEPAPAPAPAPDLPSAFLPPLPSAPAPERTCGTCGHWYDDRCINHDQRCAHSSFYPSWTPRRAGGE